MDLFAIQHKIRPLRHEAAEPDPLLDAVRLPSSDFRDQPDRIQLRRVEVPVPDMCDLCSCSIRRAAGRNHLTLIQKLE